MNYIFLSNDLKIRVTGKFIDFSRWTSLMKEDNLLMSKIAIAIFLLPLANLLYSITYIICVLNILLLFCQSHHTRRKIPIHNTFYTDFNSAISMSYFRFIFFNLLNQHEVPVYQKRKPKLSSSFIHSIFDFCRNYTSASVE